MARRLKSAPRRADIPVEPDPRSKRVTHKDLLEHVDRLPVIPGVVAELIETVDQPDASIDRVVEGLRAEPVLSAKLLRLANSAFFHRAREIAELEDAVMLVGLSSVRTLVLGASAALAVMPPPGLDERQFWTHAVTTAEGARMLATLANQRGCCLVEPNRAFTVGLMQSIGDLLVRSVHPIDMFRLDASAPHCDARRAEAQRQLLGFSYTDVSAALAERWRFPGSLCESLERLPPCNDTLPVPVESAMVAAAASIASARVTRELPSIEDAWLLPASLTAADVMDVFRSSILARKVEPLRDAILH